MRRRDWFGWLRGWLDSTDKTKDVKLLAYLLVVVAAVIWLSREQQMRGITTHWVDAFMWLCGLAGGGGVVWAAVEKWGEKRAQNDPKGPGAPDKEGP